MESAQLDFSGQNKLVLQILQSGGTINRIEATDKYRILALNSRISDLRNKYKIEGIESKWEPENKCNRYFIAQAAWLSNHLACVYIVISWNEKRYSWQANEGSKVK